MSIIKTGWQVEATRTEDLSYAELFTIGARHALDYLGYWLQISGARSVRLESSDPAVIRQCLLHIPDSIQAVNIPTNGLVDDGLQQWRILNGTQDVDVQIYPFSLESKKPVPSAPIIIGCFRNTLSYRKLLHPGQPTISMHKVRAILEHHGYSVEKTVGIYPPQFMFWWTLGLITGPRAPSLHFQFNNRSFACLSRTDGWMRHLSYLMVFYAIRRNV